MKTVDGGQHWSICSSTQYPVLKDVHFADTLTGGIVGGNYGNPFIALTEDNFISVSQVPQINQFKYATAICYQNDSIIWVSGYPSYMMRSTNKGVDFSYIDLIGNSGYQTVFDIQFFGNTGYAYTKFTLAKYVDTVYTAIPPVRSATQHLTTFPNPVTGKCTLLFNSENAGTCLLELYASDGRLVQVSARYLSTGRNELVLNLQELQPGTYFVRLQAHKELGYAPIVKIR